MRKSFLNQSLHLPMTYQWASTICAALPHAPKEPSKCWGPIIQKQSVGIGSSRGLETTPLDPLWGPSLRLHETKQLWWSLGNSSLSSSWIWSKEAQTCGNSADSAILSCVKRSYDHKLGTFRKWLVQNVLRKVLRYKMAKNILYILMPSLAAHCIGGLYHMQKITHKENQNEEETIRNHTKGTSFKAFWSQFESNEKQRNSRIRPSWGLVIEWRSISSWCHYAPIATTSCPANHQQCMSRLCTLY